MPGDTGSWLPDWLTGLWKPPTQSTYSPMEQAALSPVYGFTPGSLQNMQDWSKQQAAIQTAAGDAAAASVPEDWGELVPKAIGDTASMVYGLFEPSRANDIYNQMLWKSLNDTMTQRMQTQSQGTPFQGIF